MSFSFDESVPSDLYIMKDFIQNVLEKLNVVIDDESVLFDIKLILNELVANGVIHGNEYDKKKKVNLSVKIVQKSIRIEVTDEGNGFEYDLASYDPMDLKCSGRGLVIVSGLSDEFYINKNKVVAVKYLS